MIVNKNKSPYDVYIGRGTKWGNPFRISFDGTRKEVIRKYIIYLLIYKRELIEEARKELKGKVMGCHCKPLPCHGDFLYVVLDETIKLPENRNMIVEFAYNFVEEAYGKGSR